MVKKLIGNRARDRAEDRLPSIGFLFRPTTKSGRQPQRKPGLAVHAARGAIFIAVRP